MDISKLSTGNNPQEGEVNVVIEIPEGSFIKYEVDEESGAIMVDRFAYTTMAFPGNYGFIPNSMGEDGDPLDVLVLSTHPLYPGVVVPSRVIGMLEMEDEAGIDTKIIALPTKKVDPFMSKIDTIDDLDEIVKQKIQHFFNHYKDLEPKKWVKTKDFLGKEKALEAIKKSLKNK
ncbi:MAG: inorganic diphosphatase [Patescibacteria group bacterium]